jgi:single-strand DNA-binding protein
MLNSLQIIGNVNRVEVRRTSGGKSVCDFSVAVSEGYKDKKETTWFDVIAWEKLGELCGQYLDKGKKVYVSGSMKEEKWTSKDGVEKKRWRVVANKVLFLSPSEKKDEPMPPDEEISGLAFDNRSLEIDLDKIPF